MKKVVSMVLVLVLVCLTSVTAFSATPRAIDTYSKSVRLTIVGGSASCNLYVKAVRSSTPITGTLTLSGDGVDESWDIDATGLINTTKKVSVSSGTYTLTFSGSCGADSIDISDTATK